MERVEASMVSGSWKVLEELATVLPILILVQWLLYEASTALQ